MDQYRIVTDSSADLTALERIPFSFAPLKIITAHKEYTDDLALDTAAMVEELKHYKGTSSTSCPNPQEWLEVFGDAKYIFAVTITSGLSGSFNAAQAAQAIYEAEHPDRRVFLVDSLSAGPGMVLLLEKLQELILSGLDFDAICQEIKAYQKKTGLLFILESLTNFANNGRINPAVAKLAGFMGIHILGQASTVGTLEILEKCRGSKKTLQAMIEQLKSRGFQGGKLRIAHCFNEKGALELKERLLAVFHTADIHIYPTRGLCSFYAEKGGLLVGYEKG